MLFGPGDFRKPVCDREAYKQVTYEKRASERLKSFHLSRIFPIWAQGYKALYLGQDRSYTWWTCRRKQNNKKLLTLIFKPKGDTLTIIAADTKT